MVRPRMLQTEQGSGHAKDQQRAESPGDRPNPVGRDQAPVGLGVEAAYAHTGEEGVVNHLYHQDAEGVKKGDEFIDLCRTLS